MARTYGFADTFMPVALLEPFSPPFSALCCHVATVLVGRAACANATFSASALTKFISEVDTSSSSGS